MINLDNIKELIHNNKTVKSVTDSEGNVIWIQPSGEDPIYLYSSSKTYLWDKSSKTFSEVTGVTSPSVPTAVWTDGTDVYFTYGITSKVYDRSSATWINKVWSGLTNFDGQHVWTDGTNVYYSEGESQFVLNKATSTWEAKTWSDNVPAYGSKIWTDGTDIYYSYNSDQFVLNKATSTWEAKTWSYMANFDGENIWTDGTDIYYNKGYVLNKENSTWSQKTWSGNPTDFRGSYVWTDGETVYMFNSSENYYLDTDKVTWKYKSYNVYPKGINMWSISCKLRMTKTMVLLLNSQEGGN